MYNSNFEINRITNSTYDRVLCIDMDAIFLNDSITIDSILMNNIKNNGNYSDYNYSYGYSYNYNYNSQVKYEYGLNSSLNGNLTSHDKININHGDESRSTDVDDITDISLILAGDWKLRINAGVLIFIKSDFTKKLLQLWRSIMHLTNINDQESLALLLFHYPTIIQIYEKRKQKIANANVNTNANAITGVVINDYNYNISQFKLHVLKKFCLSTVDNEDFKMNYYHGFTVTREHINHVYNDLLFDNFIVKKHVLWVETVKLNSNIWYQLCNNDIMNQWIVHFAGQGSFKHKLIQKFVNYKKKYQTIVQDTNKQGNVTLQQLTSLRDSLQTFVLQYIKRMTKHWKDSLQRKKMMQYVMDTNIRLDKIMSVWEKVHQHQ